jgi:hypothetical protein
VVLDFFIKNLQFLKKPIFSSIMGFGFGSHNWIRLKTQFWYQFQKSDPVPVWFIEIEAKTYDANWPNWVTAQCRPVQSVSGYHH